MYISSSKLTFYSTEVKNSAGPNSVVYLQVWGNHHDRISRSNPRPWFIATWHPFTTGPPLACPSVDDHRLWQIDCAKIRKHSRQPWGQFVWSHKDLSGSGDGNLLLSHWASRSEGSWMAHILSCLSQLVIASCGESVACSQRDSSQGQWETGATARGKTVFKTGTVKLFKVM